MKVKHIFADIDGTLVIYPRNREFSVSPGEIFSDMVMKKYGISREEAWKKIKSCGDTSVHCLSEFIETLEISREAYFEALRNSLKGNLEIPDDTVRLLTFLKENSFELYTATTNPPFVTWVKLADAGLAAIDGSPFFTGYFPGCAFLDPRGKSDPGYYSKILKAGSFDPEFSLMIGDVPEKDALPAMKAGMRYGVNIDRNQSEPVSEKEGVLYINSFDVLIPMLEKC